MDNNLYYKKNLNIIINRGWQELLNNLSNNIPKPIISKTNHPTLIYKNKYIHSLYDPIKEAKRITQLNNKEELNLIIVIGLGYGYHILELLKQIKSYKCLILVFEHSYDIFTSAFYYSNLAFLGDKRVYLNVGREINNIFINTLSSLTAESIKRMKIIYLKSSYNLFKNDYDYKLYIVKELIQQQLQNQFTSLEFERLWFKNYILNSPNLFEHQPIRLLFNQFNFITALVVSAGPSLKLYINQIKQHQDKAIIISTDTALSPLLEANITPDFVVSIDTQFHNFKDFLTTGKKKLNLIYDLMVYHKIPKFIKVNRAFYFASIYNCNKIHPFLVWLNDKTNIKIDSLLAGSSVSVTAIEVARLLGCKPIILVGQDLSYPNNISHAASSPIYNDFLYHYSNKFNSINQLFYKVVQKRNLITVNTNLKSDFVLKNLNKWLGQYASIYNGLLLNAGASGFPIANVDHINLNKYFSQYFDREKARLINSILHRVPTTPNIVNDLARYYESLNHKLTAFFYVLIKELDNISIKEENILKAKKELENNFDFIGLIYKKENLWYFRKEEKDELTKQLYANILLKTTENISKYLDYTIHKLNSIYNKLF